jgi:hypothetical protein
MTRLEAGGTELGPDGGQVLLLGAEEVDPLRKQEKDVRVRRCISPRTRPTAKRLPVLAEDPRCGFKSVRMELDAPGRR